MNAWLDREWKAMLRRMLACIETRCSELAPEPLVTHAGIYTDASRHDAERRLLFMKTPLLAGFSSELREAGSILLFDAFGPPVFIVRREDGGLAAFRNVCPHRGARLLDDARKRTAFVCPFHGWRFDCDGRLVQRPVEPGFAGAAVGEQLTPVPVAERYGLIFLRLDPDGAEIDVEEFLGPIAPLIESFGLDDAAHVKTDAVVVDANWKLVVDVSCEGYHVPTTHPESLSPQLVPFLTIHDSFGRHHRFASPSRQLAELLDRPEAEWPATHYSAVHYLFPNTILTYSDAIDGSVAVVAVNRSFPGRHIGETSVLYSTYRPAGARGVDESAYQSLHDAVLQINKTEDLVTVERVWQNYSSLPASQPLVFGRNEMILQRYHADVGDATGIPL